MKQKNRPDIKDVRPKSKNRPQLVDKRPQGVLFSTAGQTGWRRRRDLRGYKGNKSEQNFNHLNDKFWSDGDDPV
jgi:hypothetical protein